jgi:hypothetical protein
MLRALSCRPVMRARLANAYVRAGGDDEKAARILGVTVGSARLAKRRHLNAPEIEPSPESLLAGRRAHGSFGGTLPGATLDRQRHAL